MSPPNNHATLLEQLDQFREALAYDHRSSIVRYMEEEATKFEIAGERGRALTLRAMASNIAAQFDLRTGKDDIASPVHAIINEVCSRFGGTNLVEVLSPTSGGLGVRKVRMAAMWVAKKRLGWSNDRLGDDFRRDGSTVSSGIHRADEIRAADEDFKAVTDQLVSQRIVCENCQHPLCPTVAESRI